MNILQINTAARPAANSTRVADRIHGGTANGPPDRLADLRDLRQRTDSLPRQHRDRRTVHAGRAAHRGAVQAESRVMTPKWLRGATAVLVPGMPMLSLGVSSPG